MCVCVCCYMHKLWQFITDHARTSLRGSCLSTGGSQGTSSALCAVHQELLLKNNFYRRSLLRSCVYEWASGRMVQALSRIETVAAVQAEIRG